MPLATEIYKKIAPNHLLISCAAYVVGLYIVLIFPSFDRRAEIEEHGLIPGYASSGMAGNWPQRLASVIQQVKGNSEITPALDQALADAQLVAHHMNFTTKGGIKSSFTYTVASSRRGDSREAVVLVVATNWTSGKKAGVRAALGLSTGVVLAQYLKTVPWLSKDVIFVFVDSSLPYGAGARAFLRAYFGGTSAIRRGVLRQAVVLDIAGAQQQVGSILLDVEGVNGMVPNQDVVNSFVVNSRDKRNFALHHRNVWDSVYHTIRNGGVHSNHAPFLEAQVPAFTVRGQKGKGNGQGIAQDSLFMALEGILRSLSNNLQQLHHSFNFYFFTGPQRHISNGLYLYPVFGMQLPIISFLTTNPAYRDIRSFLIGVGSIAATMLAAGTPIFLLATNADFAGWVSSVHPEAAFLGAPPGCALPSFDEEDAQARRRATAAWLASGATAALLVCLLLRRYAFKVFDDTATSDLPSPLWDAMRCASGFVFQVILAPLTIYSWAVAVPLTMVCVPVLIMARPCNLRRRPLRSLLSLAFLAGNLFLLAGTPESRKALLGDAPGRLADSAFSFFETSIVPSVPREVRTFLPIPLVRWFRQGHLGAALESDLLLGLHEAARDYNCVGGMLFPVFCFVYWPLLVLLVQLVLVLPAQRVDDKGLTIRQLRLLVLFVFSMMGLGIAGGVYWRSLSSSGLGALQWF